jgi:hypothetical protein
MVTFLFGYGLSLFGVEGENPIGLASWPSSRL